MIEPALISISSKEILYEGILYTKEHFFVLAYERHINHIMVLTEKERFLLIEKALIFNIKITVLEVMFPIFPNIKYNSNLYKNYDVLKKKYAYIKAIGINASSSMKYYSTVYRFKLERKMRYKSPLDSLAFFIPVNTYQEVFKYREKRLSRKIYALDFNSMYVDCLDGHFINPKKIKYINCKHVGMTLENAPIGFYKALLSDAKDSIFLRYHPLKYTSLIKGFKIELEAGRSLEVFLPLAEIVYYSKFFSSVELIEGIISDETSTYPLFDELVQLYNERSCQSKGTIDERLAKLKLTVATSVTNPRKYIQKSFNSLDDASHYLIEYYNLGLHTKLSADNIIDLLTTSKLVELVDLKSNLCKIRFINYNNKDAIYSYYATMISNSRIKMLMLIEKLLSITSCELCYANVDSIHISIDKDCEKELLELLKPMLTNKLGNLKIEAVANEGYWLDLGRFWLFDDKKLVKYSNAFFNSASNKSAYVFSRKIKAIKGFENSRYVKKKYIQLSNCLSNATKMPAEESIDSTKSIRYTISEVISTSEANYSVLKEKLASTRLKEEMIAELASVECSLNHYT